MASRAPSASSLALLGFGLTAPPAWFVWRMRTDAAFHKDMERRLPFLRGSSILGDPSSSTAHEETSVVSAATVAPVAVPATAPAPAASLEVKEDPQQKKDSKTGKNKKLEAAAAETVVKEKKEVVLPVVTPTPSQAVQKEIAEAAANAKQQQQEAAKQEAANTKQETVVEVKTEVVKQEVVAKPEAVVKTEVVKQEVAKPEVAAAVKEKEEIHLKLDKHPARVDLEALRALSSEILMESAARSKEDIEAIEKQLNKDLEKVLAQDLSTLNEAGLRERLVQLVLELKDRNKWEALRVHEVAKHTANDLVNKYEDLLRRQAHAYEAVIGEEIAKATEAAMEKATAQADAHVNRILGEKDRVFQQTLKKRLEEQAQMMRTEFEKELNDFVSHVAQQNAEELQKRSESLKELQKRLANFEQIFKDQARIITQANQAQELTNATIAFMEAAQKPGTPLEKPAAALKKASRGDPTVNAALANLSQSSLKEGNESLVSLVRRFDVVKQECRRLALVPDGGGIVSQVVSNVTSRLLISENPNLENDNSVDGILFRTNQALINSDLISAVENLEKLPPGLVADAASDWLRHARDLMITNMIIKVSLARSLETRQNQT